MIYTPDWELLADALQRVVSAHEDLEVSKAAICNAIADKKISVRVVCHERGRSTRLRATVREMKEGPSGSVIRSLIPSHREPLRSKAVVVSVAETPGQ